MQRQLLPFQGWRLTMFQAIMVAVFLIYGFRMYDFQIVNFDEYQSAAEENRLSRLPLAAPRGVIFDRFDRPLARNVAAFTVTIIPAFLPEDRAEELEIFNRISALVGIPPTAELAELTGQRIRSIEELVIEGEGIAPFRPVVIARDVDLNVALQIREERQTLPGVEVRADAVREYPTGALTAHIVGYMAPIPAEEAQALIEQGYDPAFDRIGVDGIEFFLTEELSGQRGSQLRVVDVAGEVIDIVEQVDPVPGQNVRLTIDLELQQAAQDALITQIERLNAEGRERGNDPRFFSQQGVVIAMDPRNGQILAMVSYPSYDNSRFARAIDVEYYLEVIDDPQRPLVNNAIRSLYPPGSVWKLITASGALQENIIAPQSRLFDPGFIDIENRYAPNDPAAAQRFVCWNREGHGSVDMRTAIAQSCNVYFYQVGGGNADVAEVTLRPGGLDIDNIFRYATAFGIGTELGVELPGENAGRMPDREWKRRNQGQLWSTGDTYNASLGQGYVVVSPLQLISMAATVANGGTLYQPTVIQSYLDSEGNELRPFEAQIVRHVDLEDVQETLVLTLVEDMIMKGPNSLACTCEPDSPTSYNPVRCNPQTYRNTFDLYGDGSDIREYQVSIPENYVFNGGVCRPVRFDDRFRPAFVSQANLDIVQQGMRDAATVGTANPARLVSSDEAQERPDQEIAGKTGTAEYCDNIAFALGLCVFGGWPAHAWYVGYADFDDPEIIILGFIYNGNEGSRFALPVVRETMAAYYRLKNQREGLENSTDDGALPALPDLAVPPATGG
jgi:penicillin-binding protein 2